MWREKFKFCGKKFWPVYRAYLTSPEWQAKRQAAIDRDGGECRICGGKFDLEVHHKTYDRVGAEEPNDLTTLCEKCHKPITSMLRRRRKYPTTVFDNVIMMPRGLV